MKIKKAVLAFEPFYTNGESPPLGAAVAATLLRESGLSVIPMDFCWYTRINEPGLFKLIKQYTGIWRNNNRVNFVNNIELLLYLLFPDEFAPFREELDLGLNPEAREYDLLSLGLERSSALKTDLILALEPDSVFFSVYISNLIPTLVTVKKLLETKPDIPVLLAGPGVGNSFTKRLVKVLFPKSVYFYDELSLFVDSKVFKALQILCSPAKLAEFYNLKNIITDFSGFPWPECSLQSYSDDFLFPEDDEFMGGVKGYFPVLPATGCLMKCAFCSESAIWGSIHSIEPALAAANMKSIKDRYYKPGMVLMMNSSLMNFSMDWLKEFCSCIENIFNGDPILWWAYMRPDKNLSCPELADLLYKAGLRWVSLGFESGSEKVLKKMGKGTDPQHFMDILRNLSKTGISCAATLLTGFPGESETDFNETMGLLKQWYEQEDIKREILNHEIINHEIMKQEYVKQKCVKRKCVEHTNINSQDNKPDLCRIPAPVFFDAGGMIRLEPDSILYKDRDSYNISLENRPVVLPKSIKDIPGLEQILQLVCVNWKSDVSWQSKVKRQRLLINRACKYGQSQKGRAW